MGEPEGHDPCYICQLAMGPEEIIQVLACGHRLHQECAEENVRMKDLPGMRDLACGLCGKSGKDLEADAERLITGTVDETIPVQDDS